MARAGSFRASDADRFEVADRLRVATAEGRLTADELEDRLATLYTSKTYGELDALVDDLPVVVSRSLEPRRAHLPFWVWPAGVLGLLMALGAALSALRPHPDVVAATPRGHAFRVAGGPLGDPHHALVLGASAVGVLVILLACAAAVWVLGHARRPRDA